MSDVSALQSLQKLADYRESRSHVFPSFGSLQWFVRQHRDALIASEALVLHAGQWFANSECFDAYVLRAGTATARQRALNARAGGVPIVDGA